MTSVTLIVTGEMERRGLGRALGGMFREDDIQFSTEKTDGFTSAMVKPPLPETHTNADELALRMIAAIEPGRKSEPADHVFVIEDLELENAAQPAVVVDYFRQAVRRQLDRLDYSQPKNDRIRNKIKTRCSFHLMVPMPEAYFFADPNALSRAGAQRASLVDSARIDLEAFEADDPDFLQPQDGEHKWARPDRRRHPKRYLQFLCDPEGRSIRRYRETRGGVRALQTLDWPAVLQPAESVRFLRSFIHDLADALNQPDAVIAGERHALTQMGAGQGILRNL